MPSFGQPASSIRADIMVFGKDDARLRGAYITRRAARHHRQGFGMDTQVLIVGVRPVA
jgi:hypothetical protein